jgi:hypothetical protein
VLQGTQWRYTLAEAAVLQAVLTKLQVLKAFIGMYVFQNINQNIALSKKHKVVKPTYLCCEHPPVVVQEKPPL